MSTYERRRTVDVIDRRVGLLFGVFLILLLAAVGRSLYLGTLRAGALAAAARGEHIQPVTVPALRGEITDRNGVVLALSEAGDEVIADPKLIMHRQPLSAAQIATRLAPLVGLTQQRTLTLLTKPRTGYVVLNTDVPAATGRRITQLVAGYGINGISEQPTASRLYPRGTEASQLLGWAPTGPHTGGGLELLLNKQLTGVPGKRRVINDALGNPIQVDTVKPMVPGKNIRLTISAPLQSEVEQVLAQVGKQYKPKGVTAIVTNPQTDQILALANWPAFNPNSITTAAVRGVGSQTPAVEDQAVDLSYEPGSTFKAVTVSGALQDGVVTPQTVFHIPPYLDIYGYKISDAEVHGWVNYSVQHIVKVSSNIGADLIGQRLGAQRFSHWVSAFGFGRPTGVALPGEQAGLVLPLNRYNGVTMYNMPFGQGLSVTPMQMVQTYDTVADGGVLRTPQLVAAVGGRAVPEPKGKRIISAGVASEVRNMMRGVLADGGTASGAGIAGFDMAGKTGTAQVASNGGYSKTEYVASFIGMVPASAPKLVVAVVVDQPQGVIYGGSVAAPAFQQIVGWAVPYFGINPCPVPVAHVCR